MKKSLGYLYGEILRKHRESKGLSQMALAAKAGLHLTALGNLERGRRNPSLITVFLLAEALQVSPQEMVGELYQGKPDLTKSGDTPEERSPRPVGRPKARKKPLGRAKRKAN